MPIKRINEFPEGSGSLSADDIFLFMDDPSSGGVTKKISLSEISEAINITGSGAYADQAASLVTTVFNETGSTIPKMKAVYIDGGHGDRPTVALAAASGDPTSAGTYGLTFESIDHMELGKVIVFGALVGVNTDPAHGGIPGATEGSIVYLSPTTPGEITTTKPSAPDHIVTIGTVVRVHQNQGVVEVRIVNGFELEELHNVSISGVVNNDILVYNSGLGLWENNGNAVFSNTDSIVGASGINNIVSISQANYDAIVTKDPSTLYVIS